jgi:hypothetical protein
LVIDIKYIDKLMTNDYFYAEQKTIILINFLLLK